MNDIYDESGTVVATHPVQAAQHDGNIIPVPEKWALELSEYIDRMTGHSIGNAFQYQVAFLLQGNIPKNMQPQVSESDEAVEEYQKGWLDGRNAENLANETAIEEALDTFIADLDREAGFTAYAPTVRAVHKARKIALECHRQPAAVSADAVKPFEWDSPEAKWHGIGFAKGVLTERKYTNRLRQAINRIDTIIPSRDYLNACSEDVMRGFLHMIIDQIALIPEEIRALSPETVCGGE